MQDSKFFERYLDNQEKTMEEMKNNIKCTNDKMIKIYAEIQRLTFLKYSIGVIVFLVIVIVFLATGKLFSFSG